MGLRDEADVEIVEEVADLFDVLIAVKQQNIDVVITTDSAEDRGMASHLFAEFPDVTLMLLSPDGATYIEQRCLHRRTIRKGADFRVADLLRIAVDHPCEVQRDLVS